MSAESMALRKLAAAIDEQALVNEYLALDCAKVGGIGIRVDFSFGSCCNGAKEVRHELSTIVNEMTAELLALVAKRMEAKVVAARNELAHIRLADDAPFPTDEEVNEARALLRLGPLPVKDAGGAA